MFSFPSGFVSLSDAWLLCLFALVLYIPINRFKVTLGRFENSCLPVLSQYHMYKQRIKRLAQGHNTVPSHPR